MTLGDYLFVSVVVAVLAWGLISGPTRFLRGDGYKSSERDKMLHAVKLWDDARKKRPSGSDTNDPPTA